MKRRYMLGTDDFKKLISEDALFLDKSMLIGQFLSDSGKAVLVTRPRRFGKSLNVSMLRYFLDIREQSQDLFKGLSVSEDAETMKHMNKYPVIHLSFKGVENSSWSLVAEGIKSIIADEYRRHSEVKSVLNKDELAEFEKVTSEESEMVDLQWSLLDLSRYLERYYKKKVMILVDEYDSPMNHMYELEGSQDCMYFFRSLYVNAFKGNTFLAKGFMIGILRVMQEGIFSGLNNVIAHTVFSEKYGEYFGFAEEEIKPLVEEEGLSMEEVRGWYSGYNFGGNLVYNPWSIMNYLERKKAAPYWENMSNIQAIKELIKKGGPEIKYGLELLLRGESVELEVRENVDLKELRERDVWSLLLQAGYLTYEEGEGKRLFRLPNKEIKDFVSKVLEEISEVTENRRRVEEALQIEDWNKLEEELRDSLLKAASYYDIQRENARHNKRFHHSLLLGMFVTMEAFEVRSDLESGLGRANVVLKRKDGKGTVIIELKAGSQYSEIEELLEETKEQMRKRYGEDLEGYVTRLALAFKGKEMVMSEVTR